LTAEQRLLFAILEEAIHSFRAHVWAVRPRERQIFRGAEEWRESTDTSWFFSFVNVCEVLGLDPGYVRGAARSWKAAQIQGREQLRQSPLEARLNSRLPSRARELPVP
jgi:hypothetical protein